MAASKPGVHDSSRGVIYPKVNPDDIAFVEIFPPIGVARAGDSGTLKGERVPGRDIEYYYGPEVPHYAAPPEHFKFRDSHERIKRQAARFRVYAYNSDGDIIGEINANNGYYLQWTVDVANTKGAATMIRGKYMPPTTAYRNPDVQPDVPEQQRDRLIVRPGPTTVAGPLQAAPLDGHFQGSLPAEKAVKISLGEARTDENGRLVFIGGSGHSRCVSQNKEYNPDKDYPGQPDITAEFDNIDWVDTMCDGLISVKFYHESDSSKKLMPARYKAHVLVGPPDFAVGISAPTSLYDVIENIYDKASSSFVPPSDVQFYRDIWPVLEATYNLSWVNLTAFQGHGPNGKGNFLPLEEDLKDPSAAKRNMRQHIFHRLRMPDNLNPDQASTKYMPRISGDGGDAIEPGRIKTMSNYPNPIEQFGSLTALQYDRFKRWRDGDFKTDPYPVAAHGGVPLRIEDVELSKQPEYLTRAHLETTIGDPLYPGIETNWISKLTGTYNLSVDEAVNPPFRISPQLRAGDMSKGLSLPWQSDFALCNVHWWPSARPDEAVPYAAYEDIKGITAGKPGELAMELEQTTRRLWTRLFRESVQVTTGQTDFFPDCTDMVRHWHRLGFIAKKHPGMPHDLPVFVETERILPEDFHMSD